MPDDGQRGITDKLRLLDEASRSLLGYFVHTWFRHYLSVIGQSLQRLAENGLIQNLVSPTELGRRVLFDFTALHFEKLTYVVGIYLYVLSAHKAANHRLMNRYDGKQVLYLRGYDYEGSASAGGELAMGFSSIDTMAFGQRMRDLLEPDTTTIFKVLSPKDVYWETIDGQRYFAGDYDGMIGLIRQRPRSVYLNALSWREGVADLLDRMDHYVVYVSSITESVLWELEQLDTDERRGRVTVVFDEKAIQNKELQLSIRDRLQDELGNKLIWSKKGRPPALSVAELRAQLAAKFVLTTPDEFEAQIGPHRARIAAGSSRLPAGARETWIDFRFHPAVDEARLAELRGFSAEMQEWVEGSIRDGIESLPLFLDQVQLRIYTTLLLGEHALTGRALAAYAGVMSGALDYYTSSGELIGGLSPENRESHIEMLSEHLDFARYAGVTLLAYGKSHEFGDSLAAANTTSDTIFAAAEAAVASFFKERGGTLPG